MQPISNSRSGDTLYSEKFGKRYPENPTFCPAWYNNCHLVLHKVEFFRKDAVHTHYTEMRKLQSRLNVILLTYHNNSPSFLMPGMNENRSYMIKNGKVRLH